MLFFMYQQISRNKIKAISKENSFFEVEIQWRWTEG